MKTPKRIVIDVENELARDFKTKCRQQGRSIKSVITEFIEGYIDHTNGNKDIKKYYLIVFEDKDGETKNMTIDQNLYDFYIEKGITFYLLETFSAHKVN